jgi:hypothetical protein
MIPPAGVLRFTVISGTNSYCQNLTATAGTPITTTLSSPQLIQACWMEGGAQLPPTATLESIQWQVVTNQTAAVPFDFCIEDLTAVVQ